MFGACDAVLVVDDRCHFLDRLVLVLVVVLLVVLLVQEFFGNLIDHRPFLNLPGGHLFE